MIVSPAEMLPVGRFGGTGGSGSGSHPPKSQVHVVVTRRAPDGKGLAVMVQWELRHPCVPGITGRGLSDLQPLQVLAITMTVVGYPIGVPTPLTVTATQDPLQVA